MKKNIILSESKKAALACAGVVALAGLALADDTTSGYSSLETMGQPQIEHVIQINPGTPICRMRTLTIATWARWSVWRATCRFITRSRPNPAT